MTGHPRFAWDCRRRFLESYASVVLGVDPVTFVARVAELVAAEGVGNERSLDGEALERLAGCYQQRIEDTDCVLPKIQLNSLRPQRKQCIARDKRSRPHLSQHEHLDNLHGTAVTIQAMVMEIVVFPRVRAWRFRATLRPVQRSRL